MYRVIGIVRISIIAHLLSPYGLGVFAVATISLGFLEIITETGINVFLIQEKEEIEKYINTAWVVSIFRGLFISFLIFISAGYVAKFFNSPESQSLLYLVCFVPLIRGFINPSIVKFQKNLAFNKEFLYRVSVFFVESSFSIVGAFVTKSPLGLIWGLIGGAVYEVIFTFFVVEPRPKLIFELSKIKRVISRGKWLTLFGIFDYVYTTFDNVIVGRMLGVGLLGIYQNAYKISTTPLTEVGDIFFRVTFPFFSKISDDKERLQESFLKNTIVTTVLMTAAGIFVYVFADPIVRIVLGNGWESAIPVTRLLTILGVTRGIASSTSSFLIAKQKQKYTATVTFVSAIGLLVTIVPLINIYGIMGAGMAAIIGTLISLPLTIYYVKKTFTE
jgi:O-antigen/teichoic acid export membrane protein